MRIATLHSWSLTPKEAAELQRELAPRVETTDRLSTIRLVTGLDVHYDRRRRLALAAAVTLSFPDLQPVEHASIVRPVTFPYVPGLLSFREIPALVEVLRRLRRTPDLLFCDAHGYAHPRRFGLACHVGVLADVPTIGIAKKRLVGEHAEPGPTVGDWTPLVHHDEVVGAVLRTRTNVRPIFVSTGHRVGLPTAIDLTLRCITRYRLPEPIRWAHRVAGGGAPPDTA